MSEAIEGRRGDTAGWLAWAGWVMLIAVVLLGAQPAWAEDAEEGEETAEEATTEETKEETKEEEEDDDDLFTTLGSIFKPYGFVQLDGMWDDSRFGFSPQIPGFVLSEDPAAGQAPKDESEFTMHTRLARLGLDLHFGRIQALGDVEVGGKVEVDFYAIPSSDSRNMLRMRKAYLTMTWGGFELLAGQTTDLIAPLYASSNWDMAYWGAGNLGDRRPQIRGTYKLGLNDKMSMSFAGELGLTGANDGQDLDGNGVFDGVQAALPTLQARVGFDWKMWEKGSAFGVGLWAHWALEEIDGFAIGSGNENQFESWAVGFDLNIPIWEDLIYIRGEGWTGSNLDDVRGGIFQGVNADGEEIAAMGGWFEVGANVTEWLKISALLKLAWLIMRMLGFSSAMDR